MKTSILALILTASTAMAETPNRATMGWHEFLEASGCVVVDMGGYGNIRLASDVTDPCPASVRIAFFGTGSRVYAEGESPLNRDDGNALTEKTVTVQDN